MVVWTGLLQLCYYLYKCELSTQLHFPVLWGSPRSRPSAQHLVGGTCSGHRNFPLVLIDQTQSRKKHLCPGCRPARRFFPALLSGPRPHAHMAAEKAWRGVLFTSHIFHFLEAFSHIAINSWQSPDILWVSTPPFPELFPVKLWLVSFAGRSWSG